MTEAQILKELRAMERAYRESGSSAGHWLYEATKELIAKIKAKQ